MKKQLLSLLLCGALALSLWPLPALAEEGATPPTEETIETPPEETPPVEEPPPEEAPPVEELPPEEETPPEETPPVEETSPEEETPPVELSPAQQVQALMDALPPAEEISAENAQAVAEQLAAIDQAKAALSHEELDSLLPGAYVAAAEALATLAGQAGQNSPQALVEDTGDFIVTGGTYGTDYVFEDGVLTVLGTEELYIQNKDPDTPTTNRIVLLDGAYVTLCGVNIDLSGESAEDPEPLALCAEGYTYIYLEDGSKNFLVSGGDCPGLEATGTLNIRRDRGNPAFLEARGGDQGGPGIVGGNITIANGNIEAHGGSGAPGIGSAPEGEPVIINIHSFGDSCSVEAFGGAGCYAIGGPQGSDVSIKGMGTSGALVEATSGPGYDGPAIISDIRKDWLNALVNEDGVTKIYGDYSGPIIVEEGEVLLVGEEQFLDGSKISNNGTIYVLNTDHSALSNRRDVQGDGTIYFPLELATEPEGLRVEAKDPDDSSAVVPYDNQLFGKMYSRIQFSSPDGEIFSAMDEYGNIDTTTLILPMGYFANTVTVRIRPYPYIVTIPASLELSSDPAQAKTFSVQASARSLAEGKKLVVSVGGPFELSSAAGSKIPYELLNAENNEVVPAGPLLEMDAAGEESYEATLRLAEAPPYAGSYAGSLTFTVELAEATK